MTTKSPNHPSMRTRTATADAATASAIHPAMKQFIDELVKSGSAKVLTKEESEALLENVEFDGCIAHPKSPANAPKKA